MMIRALTRHIPNSFANALSAVPPDPPINVGLARQQHLMYCMALAECGATLDRLVFGELEVIWVSEDEAYAANAVAIGKHVIIAEGFPRVSDALVTAGFKPYPVPCSEVRKADGSLTCQSIVF